LEAPLVVLPGQPEFVLALLDLPGESVLSTLVSEALLVVVFQVDLFRGELLPLFPLCC
jgi:hypothetical protein